MIRQRWLWMLGVAGLLVVTHAAQAQQRPYIGFVYPAGGQQGTTFQVRLGGQGLDGVDAATVSGEGVAARVVEYRRRLNPQELTLLREQLRELKRAPQRSDAKAQAAQKLIAKIEQRMAEYVQRPANASISNLVLVEVTMARDAKPGVREIRLATPRGVSNPLPFCVSQLPEVSRKPMITSQFQVLGKEELARRNRPPEEVEQRITIPCTMNGQIASGEVNLYRFEARKGQRLVIVASARQLVPYIADAVPGWFQPVMALYDASGKELAYSDDYRFKPDPVILCQVPKDGEYVLAITDALFRGREDFVYRVSIGELPFVTSIFPLGGRAGSPPKVEMQGWNLEGADLVLPEPDARPGIHSAAANRRGILSNPVPFALDTLPECFEQETNNDRSHAQRVKLPVIVNGRIDRRDDWDVFEIAGRAGDTIVAEVTARRLDSPLDSVLKVTDASGKLVAFNDDHEDPLAGVNTHHADSYVMVKVPADGNYYVHLGDTTRSGGDEYAYRLRLSPPQPDFALCVVPSSIGMRGKGAAQVNVQVIRKDGFSGPVTVGLKDPPPGFRALANSASANQSAARLIVRTDRAETKQPVAISLVGLAKIQGREVVREAVPVEDRMQAFLWRHLVPAQEMKVQVFDPSFRPLPRRARRAPVPTTPKPSPASTDAAGKPKFTKQQVAGRLRQLNLLFEEGLLTEEFHAQKVAECEAAQ